MASWITPYPAASDATAPGHDGLNVSTNNAQNAITAVTNTSTGAAISAVTSGSGKAISVDANTGNGTGIYVTSSTSGECLYASQTGSTSAIYAQYNGASNSSKGLTVANFSSGAGGGHIGIDVTMGGHSGASQVYGIHCVATTDDAYAVYGSATGTNSTGVYGTGTSYGVYGSATGALGNGVYGSGANAGVWGVAIASGGYGVYGDAGSTGTYGVYSQGDLHVGGTLTKTHGTFLIDHPLDPENKVLAHSFVESPDMKNVYDGVGTADTSGELLIEMPAYFEALNRDFRYQLTPIGGPAPALHVKHELSAGRFTIGGAAPGQRVCWQVTGSRRDPWAEANPMRVERDKPADERGLFLNPEAYGQPKEKGVSEKRRPKQRSAAAPVPPPPPPRHHP